uniref:Tfp pilus assembly protein PilF n=1 Tax=Candidatus Kentrum sp. FM TaxID=2126340 RepID=A0A450SHV7_9GAMM|nr:MAG: Tfp pilus assembly protein PilF [Candidatus Kentron sp. FM]VFJ54941.1 MAG: Tfp pilus assembly protein PilF [Candidatus Kentron sp. FM]VFK09932.1 MAG: Tfp pilus assembly protein PilF [Candidatus Kentron sp. FM]
MNTKTLFLSHRRDAVGKAFARLIHQALTHRGYDVFLDVDNMEPGPWAEQLEREILARAHFLLLLTPGALGKCADDNDWVRREYEQAVASRRNIVPVRSEDFDLEAERDHCPAAMESVFDLQIASVSHGAFDRDVEELIRRFLPPHRAPGKEGEGESGDPLHNLPRRNPHFTGRVELLADLGRELVENGIAELQGLGGMGKTQTALEYAHRHLSHYRFIGWLPAEDPSSLADAFAGLAPLLGIVLDPAAKQAEVIERVRRALASRTGGLLVFDNAQFRADVEGYLPAQWRGHTLITSRDPALGLARDVLSPAPFTVAEARALLARHLDADDHGETGALAQLVEALGGLPLALEQARAYLAETGGTVGRYLTLFREHRAALLEHAAPGSQAGDITVATTWSLAFGRVQEQRPESAALLNLSAFLAPAEIPLWLFTGNTGHLPSDLAATAGDAFQFDRLMATLRRHALLETHGERFSFHRLVRAVLQERLREEERSQWLERAIELLDAAFPFDLSDLATWSPSAELIPHVSAVWEAAKERDMASGELGRLLNSAGSYLQRRGAYPGARALLEAALEIHRAVFGDRHPGTATVLNNLAFLLKEQGGYAKAWPLYKEALATRRTVLGDQHPDTAQTLNNLGRLLYEQSQYPEARPLVEEALAICRAVLGDQHPYTAHTLSNLAELLRAQGQLAKARPLYDETLAIRRAVLGDEHPDTANSLNNLAYLLTTQGQYDEARPLCEQALVIRQSVFGEKHPATARSLKNLGRLLLRQGNPQEAVAYLERALVVLESVFPGPHMNTMECLYNLGVACTESGEPARARAYLARARKMKAEHPEYRAVSLEEIDAALAGLGEERREG